MALHANTVRVTTAAGANTVTHGLTDSVGRAMVPQSVHIADPAGGATISDISYDDTEVTFNSVEAGVEVVIFTAARFDPIHAGE